MECENLGENILLRPTMEAALPENEMEGMEGIGIVGCNGLLGKNRRRTVICHNSLYYILRKMV